MNEDRIRTLNENEKQYQEKKEILAELVEKVYGEESKDEITWISEEAKEAKEIITKNLSENNPISIGTIKRLYLGGDDEEKEFARELLAKTLNSDPNHYRAQFAYTPSRSWDKVYPPINQIYDNLISSWNFTLETIKEDSARAKKGRK